MEIITPEKYQETKKQVFAEIRESGETIGMYLNNFSCHFIDDPNSFADYRATSRQVGIWDVLYRTISSNPDKYSARRLDRTAAQFYEDVDLATQLAGSTRERINALIKHAELAQTRAARFNVNRSLIGPFIYLRAMGYDGELDLTG